MIRILSNVLDAAELQQIHALLPTVKFADGRMTNRESTIKQNLQAPQDDPCLLYTSPSPRDVEESRMPSSA